MDEKLKKKWVKALRSGKYEQAEEYLKDGNSYCCLGVLCEITPGIEWDEGDGRYVIRQKKLKSLFPQAPFKPKRKDFEDEDAYYDALDKWEDNFSYLIDGDEWKTNSETGDIHITAESLPKPLVKFFGMDKKVTVNKERLNLESKLIRMNDYPKNFNEIADYIEKVNF